MDCKVIAVTGAVGAGKSTLAVMLAGKTKAGFVSADKAAHDVLQQDDACAILAEIFGTDIIGANGKINRSALAEKAFANTCELQKLTAIVYPRIRKILANRLAELKADSTARIIVLEAPTLYEAKCDDLADLVITVEAKPGICDKRCQENRNWPAGEAARRESFLIGSERRQELADITVWNNTTRKDMENNVDGIIESYITH